MHKLLITVLLSAFVSCAYAQDARISQLEKDVQELKARVARLENPSSAAPSANAAPVASADGWKQIANWRKLSKDMSMWDVRGILGEPARQDGGNFTNWFYPNRGVVTFYESKLYMWQEPR